MSAATSASAGITTYSATPPIRSVKALRNRCSVLSVDLGSSRATSSVRSPPPCGEGLGVGVGVITRAASTNGYPHPYGGRSRPSLLHRTESTNDYPHP